MATGTHQWMRNPDTKGEWECPIALVDVYTRRGWEPFEPPEPVEYIPTPVDVQDVEPEVTAFDPGDHTVKDVLAYIEQYQTDSPGEVQRVLALEAAGKNRPTILGIADADENKE
jgi:hypothetical protein